LDISLIPVEQSSAAAPELSSSEGTAELRLLVETTARLARMLEQKRENPSEPASAPTPGGNTVVEFKRPT
ncbi:MAG TPA: hypothetical protein VL025_11700, partial [Thermoanaerobaculia bacterium]|nr:hypothetical protein [Thermoanaerobaculia bacterium]